MIRKLIEYQEKIIMDKHIHTPITEEITADLKAGDYVYITGTLYVARDAAHKRMMEVLDEGKELPIDIKDCTIYYMGPSPAREGRPIGSAGPTTASRMDKYAPRLLDLGEKAREFAKIYDELINEDINYDEMVERILEICNLYNVELNDYLDIACGTGNVTIRIAKYFKNIYGVDLSEDMLREAFDKFKEARIKGKIICQDMTELSLNKEFDLITSVLDSTNYITDLNDLQNYFKPNLAFVP